MTATTQAELVQPFPAHAAHAKPLYATSGPAPNEYMH